MIHRFGLSALMLAGVIAVAPSANAFSAKGWQYSMDSFNDSSGGLPGGGSGVGENTNYEIRGIATQLFDGKLRIGIQSNLGIHGASSQYADDGHIHWGDIIINTACEALDNVGKESLFGIRFAQDNESGVQQVGLFKNITLFEKADENGNPGANLAGHNQWVRDRKGNPSFGNLANGYFNENTHVDTLIRSGEYVSGVNIIQDTSGWDLDGFDGLRGQILGLEVDISSLALSNGQTVCLHASAECNNDIAGGQFVYDVPTPAAVLPVLSGLFAAAKRKNKKEEALG
ncbi:PTPA-CTERM sorting domain-containing protein [[Limnothrix rosea] IAM M-220]|uniref:PTPA-CTERM sorting domain-containing protein n=1 Tax=[Limnothrix rosea] IAM M-220 TaxID=454133 RepID=UPI0009638EDA|nr:PTPA-CTERM sorting domain-containing protein [[Limnothrix rosea] IAM M-220]OKH14199.1 hypothetical protein NIES208_14230 [[Limnothrix rosea] IAM M-220]